MEKTRTEKVTQCSKKGVGKTSRVLRKGPTKNKTKKKDHKKK